MRLHVRFAPESDRKSGHAASFTGLILAGSSQNCCRCRYLVALSIDFELPLADRQAESLCDAVAARSSDAKRAIGLVQSR